MSHHEKYDAFISYRHCLPDSEIASRLQKKLESFRLPKDIAKKTGRTRLNSVFLDETELSVSDDLSVELSAALLNSDYLITICSPEYLKSKWCMREIQTFLQYNDRKKVLLILADGEPENAFPEMLLYETVYSADADGRITKSYEYKEPLAADCRGETSKERKEKIDVAVIRLVAAIMGIRFDDLQQRHRKEVQTRKRNRTLAAFAILGLVIAICLFFIVMIVGKNREIEQQNQEIALQNEIITQKYADSLAATSDSLLHDGNRSAAVYAARLALPDEETDDYSELAYKSLVNALGLYSLPDEFSAGDDITLPCAVDEFELSPDGDYISVLGLDGSRYILDLRTDELVFSYTQKEYSYFGFDGEDGFVFQEEYGNYMYYDLSSGKITDLSTDYGIFRKNPYGQGYAYIDNGIVDLRRGTDSVFAFYAYNEIPDLSGNCDIDVVYTPNSDRTIINVKDFDKLTSYIFDVNINNGTVSPVSIPDNGLVLNLFADESSILFTVYSYPTCVYRKDLNTNSTVSIDIDEIPVSMASSGNTVVVVSADYLYVLDSDLGILTTETISQQGTEITVSDGCVVLIEGTSGFHVIKDGNCEFHEMVFQNNNEYSWNRSYSNGVFYAAKYGENIISTYTNQQSDYISAYFGTPEFLYFPYEGDPQIAELKEFISENIPKLDESQIFQIIPCDNADIFLVQLDDGTINIYDEDTGEAIKTIYALDGYARCFYYDSSTECYYIGTNNTEVYDEDFRNIYQIPDCSLAGIDPETGYPVAVKYSGEMPYYYLIRPVTYSELISAADEYLDGYVPDDKVKERYGLE